MNHESRKRVLVERPDFHYGAKDDWASACGDTADLIAKSTTPGTAEKPSCTCVGAPMPTHLV